MIILLVEGPPLWAIPNTKLKFNELILFPRNMDSLTFGEFMEALTKQLKKYESQKADDTISMQSLLKPKIPDPDSESLASSVKEFMRDHADGNYLKAREAGEKP